MALQRDVSDFFIVNIAATARLVAVTLALPLYFHLGGGGEGSGTVEFGELQLPLLGARQGNLKNRFFINTSRPLTAHHSQLRVPPRLPPRSEALRDPIVPSLASLASEMAGSALEFDVVNDC